MIITMNPKTKTDQPIGVFRIFGPLDRSGNAGAPHRAMLRVKRSILRKLLLRMNKENCSYS